MAYGARTIADTATLIVAVNSARKNLDIVNNDPSKTVFIGPDSSVSTSNGIPLYANQTRSQDKIPEGYLGNIYGIVASGTADVRYWETTQ